MPSGIQSYILTYVALVLLLAATIAISLFRLGMWNPILNLGIAALKAALILWVFMHVGQDQPVVRVFAAAGFFWLMIMFGLTLTDYLTR